MKKYLYLPLEIVNRENDAKMTLASFAAQNGWSVVISTKIDLYDQADSLPPGVFLLKSAVPSELKQIKYLKKFGHKVFSLDEEGVVTYDIFLEGDYRYDESTINLLDGIFFWGEKQQLVFKKNLPKFFHKSKITGNPRTEFWKKYASKVYRNKVNTLKEKYGDFIFIPTSFGIANNFLGGNQGIELSFEMLKKNSKKIKNFLEGQQENNKLAFKEYLDFIPILANHVYPKKVIIRPHPSESDEQWKKIAKLSKNIIIHYDGPVTPWILASKLMIHFKSTTSIESNLMNKQTLTYIPPFPEYMDKFELALPRQASIVSRSREETLKKSYEIVIEDFKFEMLAIKNNEWIFLDSNVNPIKILLSEIDKHKIETLENIQIQKKKNISIKKIYEKILMFINNQKIIHNILPRRLRRNPLRDKYGKRKREGLNFEHNKSILEIISSEENFNKNLEIKRLSETIFLVNEKS